MRDIFFRGKSKKHDKWIYGDYVKNRGFDFVVPRRFVSQEETWEDFEIVPETLGQAIGVCDVNGNNIYEGDKIGEVDYTTYEEAVEAALKYSLENLI